VLDVTLSLPPDVSGRITVWLKGTDPLASLEDLSSEIELAIGTRNPTGDDLHMIDRILADLAVVSNSTAWGLALGEAPNLADVRRQLNEHQLASDTLRCCRWIGILPEIAPKPWAEVFSMVAAKYGPLDRRSLERRPLPVASWGQSPLDVQEIAAIGPTEAARVIGRWRTDPNQFMVGPRELARTLQAAVALDLSAWLLNPMQTAGLLREPIHIAHYLAGVEQAINCCTNLEVSALLDVVHLVHSQPWLATCLGRPDWDYDPDWRQAEAASISLVRSLADNDIGFGDRADEMWQVLDLAVHDRTEHSALDGGDDLLNAAINRPCTKAFEAALSFVLWEHRATGSIRQSATDLLNGVLCLEGVDGSQFRSVLASRFRILFDHVPTWVSTLLTAYSGPTRHLGSASSPWMKPYGGAAHHNC
jgi:hypothetical protein